MSIIPTPPAFGSCRTTCRPIRPAPSMRHSRPPRPAEFCAASSSTTPPSMPVGSIWSRSRLACCAASASTAESTTQTGSAEKSTPGNDNETPPAPASIGCSQPTKPAPKWAAPIPSCPKSHNHCGEVLAPIPVLAIFAVIADMLDGHHVFVFGGVEHDDALGGAAGDPDALDRTADQLTLVGHQHDLVGILDRE